MTERKCLRCGVPLQRVLRENIQLGKTTWFFGDLPNLLAGGLDVVVMSCPVCGEFSFFRPDEADDRAEASNMTRTCPECGKEHYFAERRCPHCGHSYL